MSPIVFYGQQMVNGLVIGMGYALFAAGVGLIYGVLHVLNFAHGEFFMLGAVGTYLIMAKLGVDYFTAGILTTLAVGAFGLLFERLLHRPLTDHWGSLLITFGLSLFLVNAVQLTFGGQPKDVTPPFQGVLQVGEVFVTQHRLVIFCSGLVLLLGLMLFVRYTAMGRTFRAVQQSTVGAIVVGINIPLVYMLVFGLSGALAALAGMLLGPLTFASPWVGAPMLLKGFAIVIIGGVGNLAGALIGGLVLGVAESVGGGLFGTTWQDLISYVALLLVLYWRPEGLLGRREGL